MTTHAARVASVAAALVIVSLGLAGCQSIIEPRSRMTVDDVLDAFAPHADLPVTDPVPMDAQKCKPADGCDEAVGAEEISIYRFDSVEQAQLFAETLGDDGYHSDWIVLEYPSAHDDTDFAMLSYAGIVDSMWTSD